MNPLPRVSKGPGTPDDASAALPSMPTRADSGLWARVVDAALGSELRMRRRTTQWLMSLVVYSGSALVMVFGMYQGWLDGGHLLAWVVFVALAEAAVYLALRTGWSERLADPALTAVQMVLGVVAVAWGYLFCGPVRSVTLYPLMLIFVFGAFSLNWRRIAWLTAFALVTLVACVAALNATRPGPDPWSLQNPELRFDVMNVLALIIALPALSMVAARLSAIRHKLLSQRAELALALAEVQRRATHDELTGLPNRRHMQQRLAQEHARQQRGGDVFSVALLDLDHFKRINDMHGHAVGDEVLRAFAATAVATLREGDLFARWGGEEFLLLLPATRGPQAHATLLRLLERVHGLDLALALGVGDPLAFSAGVTEQRPDEPVAETVARADREMYEAKRAGRDAVRLG